MLAVARGTALPRFSVGARTIENVLRPVLIPTPAQLSMLPVLSGLIGGVLAFAWTRLVSSLPTLSTQVGQRRRVERSTSSREALRSGMFVRP